MNQTMYYLKKRLWQSTHNRPESTSEVTIPKKEWKAIQKGKPLNKVPVRTTDIDWNEWAGKLSTKFPNLPRETPNPVVEQIDRAAKSTNDTITRLEMSKISNLIMDMALRGATPDELGRANNYAMAVIDATKHRTDYAQSAKDNDIDTLMAKYQAPTSKQYCVEEMVPELSSHGCHCTRNLQPL